MLAHDEANIKFVLRFSEADGCVLLQHRPSYFTKLLLDMEAYLSDLLRYEPAA